MLAHRLIPAALGMVAAALGMVAAGAAMAASAPPSDRLRACLALTRTAPVQAIEEANRWRLFDGGLEPRRCLGLALIADGKPRAAAEAFEVAAGTASGMDAAELWAQAGHARLLADDPAGAHRVLTEALRAGEGAAPPPVMAALLTDRAGAALAGGELAAARADLDRALALTPADAPALTMRAAVARQQGDLAAARADIEAARRAAPEDPVIRAEAARIANAQLDGQAARAAQPLAPAQRPF